MSTILGAAVLAGLAGQSFAQLEGRGFPDCENGPLKNNMVCDQSAGKFDELPMLQGATKT